MHRILAAGEGDSHTSSDHASHRSTDIELAAERQAAGRVIVLHGNAAEALKTAIQATTNRDPNATIFTSLAWSAIRAYDRAALKYQSSVETP